MAKPVHDLLLKDKNHGICMDDDGPDDEMLCSMTRYDQWDENEFV